MSESNKKPAARISLHPVYATIWRNESRDGDAFYSTVFERRYRDKDQKWQSSDSFNGDELLLLAKAADLAHTEVMKLRLADRKARPSEDADDAAA